LAGSVEGGRKAAAKNLLRNPNFYRDIAMLSVESYNSKPKDERRPRGFAANKERARLAGAKGGRKSRRTKSK
jgi:uncharacterized protein